MNKASSSCATNDDNDDDTDGNKASASNAVHPFAISASSSTMTDDYRYDETTNINGTNTSSSSSSSSDSTNGIMTKRHHSSTPPPTNLPQPTATPIGIASSWSTEIQLMLNLTFPTVIIQIGAVLPNFLIASEVGRLFGSIYLDGFTLAVLMGNLCNLSLLQGLYTAADTLSPQAYTAHNYSEVGLLAIRGVVASWIVMVPINVVLVLRFEQLLLWVGQNPETAAHAHTWYHVYVMALPFYSLYNVTWKFLSAQEVMRPLIYVCIVCCGVILPLGVWFGIGWFGYIGSAWTIVFFQASQAILLLSYVAIIQPHTAGTWPGLTYDTLQLALFSTNGRRAFGRFLCLGLGGMLATSEWIYWESLALIIGTMGVVPLSVHTIPTQVIMVGFMFPMGVGIALSVRLGATLPLCVQRARTLTIGTAIVGTFLFGTFSVCMYLYQDRIIHIFTTEQAVVDGAHQIWTQVCIYYFNLSIYGINMGIATGLGEQWMFGIVTLIFLWGFSLPGMYYFCIIRGGGLVTAWKCISQPYVVMNLYLLYQFLIKKDWKAIQHAIRIREHMEEENDDDNESVNVDDPNLVLPLTASITSTERTNLLRKENGKYHPQ